MATVRSKLDPGPQSRLSENTRRHLDRLTDEQLTANAMSDPDNPPLTTSELERIGAARAVKRARVATGLSQNVFAKRFRINAARLRDWEQGRTLPDSAALAYLAVIEKEQAVVERVLAR